MVFPVSEGENAISCSNCHVLAAEVAHLKRELARRSGEGTVSKNPPVALVGTPCIHGGWYGRCRILGCEPAKEKKA